VDIVSTKPNTSIWYESNLFLDSSRHKHFGRHRGLPSPPPHTYNTKSSYRRVHSLPLNQNLKATSSRRSHVYSPPSLLHQNPTTTSSLRHHDRLFTAAAQKPYTHRIKPMPLCFHRRLLLQQNQSIAATTPHPDCYGIILLITDLGRFPRLSPSQKLTRGNFCYRNHWSYHFFMVLWSLVCSMDLTPPQPRPSTRKMQTNHKKDTSQCDFIDKEHVAPQPQNVGMLDLPMKEDTSLLTQQYHAYSSIPRLCL
jgi:hypothetical protein